MHAGRTSHRTARLTELGVADIDTEVQVAGWVHRRRDLGGLMFLDLRDRSGLLQVSFGSEWMCEEDLREAFALGSEDVIAVWGRVERRLSVNPEMATGEIEVRATRFERLGAADTPAIPVYRGPEEELPSEELRLRHRVLDLRRPELQANLTLRHALNLETRNYLDGLGFLEVETPMLTKRTPEGARDFLVPSRVHPGQFFALPQSPQIYKQLLMVAGFDRYFQIARCFRDEDLRADRQPEFTQIDVEASFIAPDDLLGWIEGLMTRLADRAGRVAELPFPRLTHQACMERFASDRPDLRCPVEVQDWGEVLAGSGVRIVDAVLSEGGRVRGLIVPEGGVLSRKQIEAIEDLAKATGAPGLLWAKRTDEALSGPLSRGLDADTAHRIGLNPGDLALAAAGPDAVTHRALDAVRVAAWEAAGGVLDGDAWLWVEDFPLFEEHEARLTAGHHPFVLPHPEDLDLLESDPVRARGLAYDLVYNGSELGSGSLRIHRSDLQRKVFGILGLSEEEIEVKFGFLLKALDAGAPPHGGIALGVDRIVQRFADAGSLRDVIAFPKTTAARALLEQAPTAVSDGELADLHIRVLSNATPNG